MRTRADEGANGLNLLRLVLAAMVLVSHACVTTGRTEPKLEGQTLGHWAVIGFFGVSGYLVTQSRRRLPGGSYLLRRSARILPGYWVCLVVTAAVATVMLVVDGGAWSTADGPVGYIVRNALLWQVQGGIADTLTTVPYPGVWNASLWTLPFEAICYLVVGGLVAVAPARGRVRLALISTLWLGVTALHVGLPHVLPDAPVSLYRAVMLIPFFLGGAMVQEIVPIRQLDLVWATLLLAGGIGLVMLNNRVGGQVAAPALAYAVMTVGARLPSPAWVRENDLSYGLYIYAFPVSQTLVVAGLVDAWFPAYVAAVVVVTLVLALLSWILVERRAQLWAKRRGRSRSAIDQVAA